MRYHLNCRISATVAALLSLAAAPAFAEGTAVPAAEPATPAAAATTTEGATTTGAPVTAQTVVATVNGTAITVGHMLVLRGQLPQEYQSLPNDVLFKGILDQLVQQTTLMQSIEAGIGPRDTIALENERRAYLAGAAIEAASGIAITDEALQEVYTEKYAQAEPSKEFRAAHILVATKDAAQKLKGQIDGGADFGELAMANSTDGAAASGGDLGWFGRGMMVKEFEDAVVAMEPGEVSDPVQTQFGWHLIKLSETRTTQAPTLDAVRDELTGELRKRAVDARIATLTADAQIEKTDAGIDPAILSDQTLLAN